MILIENDICKVNIFSILICVHVFFNAVIVWKLLQLPVQPVPLMAMYTPNNIMW
jgi:hypothetical protein